MAIPLRSSAGYFRSMEVASKYYGRNQKSLNSWWCAHGRPHHFIWNGIEFTVVQAEKCGTDKKVEQTRRRTDVKDKLTGIIYPNFSEASASVSENRKALGTYWLKKGKPKKFYAYNRMWEVLI